VKNIEGINYKGFYGTINKMSLSDRQDGHQIIFNYAIGPSPTVFLFYKGHQSFYIIIVNSLRGAPLDESMIDIFNLI
jgi:hypothetical protein